MEELCTNIAVESICFSDHDALRIAIDKLHLYNIYNTYNIHTKYIILYVWYNIIFRYLVKKWNVTGKKV